jgi:aminomethyltransferase
VAAPSGWATLSLSAQYRAVREAAGVFPCGGMYYLSLCGPDAVRVLDLLTPRRVDRLKVGHASFVVFTTPGGTVDTEGVALRTGDESFLVSIGGDAQPPRWLPDACSDDLEVGVAETSYSSFNIKGPAREEAMIALVSPTCANQVRALGPFRSAAIVTAWGQPAWVVRTIIGIELWGEADVVHEAWTRMVARPEIFTPCGWDLLATYRLECTAFPFYLCPLDIHRGTNLLDVGLGHVVSGDKSADYVGRAALEAHVLTPDRMWAAGLVATQDHTPRRKVGEKVMLLGTSVTGYITSAGSSPQIGREVCFAHLPRWCGPGSQVRFADGSVWGVTELPILKSRRPIGERR